METKKPRRSIRERKQQERQRQTMDEDQQMEAMMAAHKALLQAWSESLDEHDNDRFAHKWLRLVRRSERLIKDYDPTVEFTSDLLLKKLPVSPKINSADLDPPIV